MARTSPAAWTVAEVEADKSWTYALSDAESAELLTVIRAAVRKAGPADKPILDWRRDDVALDKSIANDVRRSFDARQARVLGMKAA